MVSFTNVHSSNRFISLFTYLYELNILVFWFSDKCINYQGAFIKFSMNASKLQITFSWSKVHLTNFVKNWYPKTPNLTNSN